MRAWLWLWMFPLTGCGGNVILDGGGTTSGEGASGATSTPASVGVTSTGTTAASGSTSCVPCGAVFKGADPQSICPGMQAELLKAVVTCTCQSSCQTACVELCTAGGPFSQACTSCEGLVNGNGCYEADVACLMYQ